MSRSPTFCILPWVHLATNASGSLRVCCNSTPGANLLKKENGSTSRLNTDSVEDAWNSALMVKVRTEMLEGKQPEICQRCFVEEKSGVRSARQRENEKWQSLEENSSRPSLNPKCIDLRLGNLCNLKCRMCNPYASSKWVSEWNQVVGSAKLVPEDPLSEAEAKRLSKMTWMEDAKTWENLESVVDQIEEIYLTGGEPTLIKKQYEFLETLVKSGRARKLSLRYNTNLTTISAKLLKIWENFKRVKLNISIDGLGALNEYIRHPSQWDELERNLRVLFEIKSKCNWLQINIHTTVQNYNILHLEPLFSFLEEHFNVFPYLNILNHPQGLNIRALPEPLKLVARERLKKFEKKNYVKEIFRYMETPAPESHFKEFQSFTRRCDELRGQNFLNLCPEFEQFWVTA